MNNLLEALRRGGVSGGGSVDVPFRHAYNAGRFSYYSAAYPFINVAKNFSGYWGPNAGVISSNGWPSALGVGLTAYADIAFSMDPSFGYFPPGAYTVTSSSAATIAVTNPASGGFGLSGVGTPAVGSVAFTAVDVGAGNWTDFFIRISLTNNTGAPIAISDLVCCLDSERADYVAGELFKADYLALYADARVIRFLDWFGVNARYGDFVRHYADMHNDETRASWSPETGYPVPISVCMKFARKLGAEPMIPMPAGYNVNWFGVNATTNRVSHYYSDQATIWPHQLVNGDLVLIDYYTSPLVGCAPLARQTPYYVINATTNDYQLSLTPGGSAIDITGVGTTPGGTDYATIGIAAPDAYNDLYKPFMAACYAEYPGATIHVTWTNEFWNTGYIHFGVCRTNASYQATGGYFNFGSAAAYNLLRVWKAAEQYYPANKVNIVFDNQAAFPGNAFSGVWDYVDTTGVYGAAGQTVSQIYTARPTRAFYSFAPYAYLDFTNGDYNSAGMQPDYVYANNGNSFTIPDSYWDGLFANGLTEAVNQTSGSIAYARAKVPGVKCTTYEWGLAFTTNLFANTHTGGVLTIASLKTYLDGAKGATLYQNLFTQTVIDQDLYCANQLMGPSGWRASESVCDTFGIRDATPGNTSLRWNYFQTV